MDDRWLILRMAASRTVLVAESLAKAGYEIWTPTETVSKRSSRSQRRKKVAVAVMPTFVFARAHAARALLIEAANPVSNHPDFSVFRFDGRIPLITDQELDTLRAAIWRQQPKGANPTFANGDPVRVAKGAATGMTGIVERTKGKFVLITFPQSKQTLEIASFMLVPDGVEGPSAAALDPRKQR